MQDSGGISAADWGKGITLSIVASLIGGASKLAIRKSWLMEECVDCIQRDYESSSQDLSSLPILSLESSADLASPEPHRGMSPDDRIRARRRCIALFLRYSGMVGMSILNPICCVLAMQYASPSILAPFSGLTLVWVFLFSGIVVGEIPSTAQKTASMLIIVGEVIVAVFGDHRNDVDIEASAVITSYKDPYFLSFFVALTLYMGLLMYWIKFSNCSILRRFAWGSCGGAITGLQNFLKDSLVLFQVSTSLSWFMVFCVMMAGASAFCGLLMLTACMKRYDATYSAASFVGSFVVSASIMSAVHYKTFQGLKGAWDCTLYPVGLAVLMVGVIILARENREAELEIQEEDEEVPSIRRNSEDSQDHFMYSKVDGETEGSQNAGL